MSDRKTTILFLGALMFAAAGLVNGASAAQPAKLSGAERTKFSECMGMKDEDVSRDAGCLAVMKKINVTQLDMAKMKACETSESNSHADVGHNHDCTAMMKKHPELVHGLGRDEM